MRAGTRTALTLAIALAAMAPSLALGQSSITGVWRSKQQSEVTISACGSAFCGKLTKVVTADGRTTDANNENASLRTRKLQGLQILKMSPTSKATRFEGEVYNPEDGKTYTGNIEIKGADRMTLNGCVLIFCKGEDWTRIK